MSWEQYFGAEGLRKTKSSRILSEVKKLAHRRDNMVARVVSVNEHRRKNRSIRTAQWISVA